MGKSKKPVISIIVPVFNVEKQKKNVEALGLSKIGSSAIHEDGPVVRGMIKVVSHLVKVEDAE